MITHAWLLIKTCLHASHFYALDEHNNYYSSGTRSEQVSFSPSRNNDPFWSVWKPMYKISFFLSRWQYNKEEMKRLVTWAKCYFFFCCSNNVKMQVYSAQTNKKIFVYASGFCFIVIFFSPPLFSHIFPPSINLLVWLLFSSPRRRSTRWNRPMFRLAVQF